MEWNIYLKHSQSASASGGLPSLRPPLPPLFSRFAYGLAFTLSCYSKS